MSSSQRAIEFLARSQCNVRHDSLEQIDAGFPYLHIRRDNTSERYRVEGHNHQGHDNEPRMKYVCDFLEKQVLPYLDASCDASGYYNIELHDSYTYLSDRARYQGKKMLAFCRGVEDNDTKALLPDTFMMGNYGDLLSARDTVPWEAKDDVLFFRGTTTGDRDARTNRRVQACLWARAQKTDDAVSFKITNIAQMTQEHLMSAVGQEAYNDIIDSYCDPQSHFAHKFLVNIPGNTFCWSRVPMIMASKSLMLDVSDANTDDVTWYSPLLLENVYFARCSGFADLLRARSHFLANPDVAKRTVENANHFARTFLNVTCAALYCRYLFEAMAARTSTPFD